MTDITPSRDCGNSPKNQFAEQIAIAMETGDTGFARDALDDNVMWESSKGDISGRSQVLARLEQALQPDRLFIDHVVTHGSAGAVNGVAEHEGSMRPRRFCYILTFTNTKCRMLRRITSFQY